MFLVWITIYYLIKLINIIYGGYGIYFQVDKRAKW